MWWESSADKTGNESLIGNVVATLGTLENSDNCIDYPHSKFDNVKCGFKA